VAEAPARRPVAAVVVNYNAASHLVPCVKSLLADGVDEVVVADNGSVDGSDRVLEAAGLPVRFLPTGANRGYGGGANFGLAATRADLVVVCNSDLVVKPGSIPALISAVEGDERRAIAGPRIVDPDGSLYPSARTFPALGDAMGHAFLGLVAPRNRWSARYKMLDWDHAEITDVDWVSGACFLVRRSAFEELGGFDESYFMYSEDVDLCWRAWHAGWRVTYQPAAEVVHDQGVSTDRRPYRMIAEHHRSLMRFAWRTTPGWRRLLLPVVAFGLVARTLLAWAQRARPGPGPRSRPE
jgi:N-acetylglucosaminyl-diphospho-decaprenol L-rhamnosyltransferase